MNRFEFTLNFGADKDKAFLELSGGNKFNAVNYLVDNQNFSKEVLEQGLMNSIKKGILTDNNEEDINIFNTAEDINFSFKQEDTNVFSNLYSRFEFSKETYEKAIKEAIKENKYELVTEILKDTKLTMKESDLQEIQNVDKEQYETINKINLKNKLSDNLNSKKALEDLSKSLNGETTYFVQKNKNLDKNIKI